MRLFKCLEMRPTLTWFNLTFGRDQFSVWKWDIKIRRVIHSGQRVSLVVLACHQLALDGLINVKL